jgi:hypothetical protein
MIDPDLLDEESRELWDQAFPDGFWAGAPHQSGDEMRLYAFAHACQTLHGYVPGPVARAIDPNLPGLVQEYMANVKAARDRKSRQQ